MKLKEYRITKEHCQSMISGVCDGCGGDLEPIETVDNSGNPTYWAGCMECEKFCYGVSRETFNIAEIMVKELRYAHYNHLGIKKEGDEGYQDWLRSQIAGACSILGTVNRAKEILKQRDWKI